MNTIDRDTLLGPGAEPMPGSIAEGGHPQVRLSHPAGLARRNRVRTDIETLAVDVEVDVKNVYDVDSTESVDRFLKQYIADVFGKDGWTLLDHSPIREYGDGRDYLGVKVNVVEGTDSVDLNECEHVYVIIRTDEGRHSWVVGQFKDKLRATRLARNYVVEHPGANVSVVEYAASEVVASFEVDQKAPATIFARCILSRSK